MSCCFPGALALAQDVEETLDEEARPEAKVVGQAGYAYQGKADIDGGGDLKVHRLNVGLLGEPINPPYLLQRQKNVAYA